MSGAGLPCSTSSPATDTANASPSPALRSVRSRRSRTDEDATATASPRERTPRTVSSASANGSSAESISSNSVAEYASQNAPGSSRPGDPRGEVRVHARERQADQARVLVVADRVPVRLERPLPRLPRQRLGVHQRAVAVEDDGRERAAHLCAGNP